jgi:hypothetical protein
MAVGLEKASRSGARARNIGTARSKDGTIRFDRLFSSFSANHKKTGGVLVVAERNEKGRNGNGRKMEGRKMGL